VKFEQFGQNRLLSNCREILTLIADISDIVTAHIALLKNNKFHLSKLSSSFHATETN